MTPRWIPGSAVIAVQEKLSARHGGVSDGLSGSMLESSLKSPRHLLARGTDDVFGLATEYVVSLLNNHRFNRSVRPVALTVAGVFLEINGFRLNAPEVEAAWAIDSLSSGKLDERGFCEWLRIHSVRHASPPRRSSRPQRK